MKHAELLAEEELPGAATRSDSYDAFLVRDRACWLVSRTVDGPLVAKVSADVSRVFESRRSWPSPRPGKERGFASPLPDGGLAVIGNGLVTVYDAAAEVRWTYAFQPWPDVYHAGPSCTADGTGRRLLVTTPGPLEAPYRGDLCVALDLVDGRPVAETVLPSATAGYVFQQSLADPHQVFLGALQGDTFYAFEVTPADEELRATDFGENDPFLGLSLNGAAVLMDVGGQWLSRWTADADSIVVEAEDVLPEGLRFVGSRPGFLDDDRVIVAVAEEEASEANRHLLLDGRTLQPLTELRYPGTTCPDPLALGDGTWLTVHGDTVRRWAAA
ncbi:MULTISPECIES: hypothetical protein [Streptomyces]|uniref:Uncharacterized protein n=2 Tax=Streptomyces TaxID=1883 RepID=A0A2U9P3L2_STRAS|nr:hypothetical protein [Streptomyces actuosus]AWT44092.1 hypothetical protein DMT42_18395 [Streptomyces actuosus]MBM4820758.1 hypothetical protein [Streptomyces actuosus]